MSHATRESLIQRVRNPDDSDAWDEFWGMYRPLLRRYAKRFKIDEYDAQDLEQDLYVKLKHLIAGSEFERIAARPRGWLRGITDNKIGEWIRSRQRQHGHVRAMAEYLYHIQVCFSEAPVMEKQRRIEWRRYVLQFVMQHAREEFPPGSTAMACFERICVQGRTGAQAAAELGLEDAGAAYAAAWRVLERIRAMCALYDEEICDADELS